MINIFYDIFIALMFFYLLVALGVFLRFVGMHLFVKIRLSLSKRPNGTSVSPELRKATEEAIDDFSYRKRLVYSAIWILFFLDDPSDFIAEKILGIPLPLLKDWLNTIWFWFKVKKDSRYKSLPMSLITLDIPSHVNNTIRFDCNYVHAYYCEDPNTGKLHVCVCLNNAKDSIPLKYVDYIRMLKVNSLKYSSKDELIDYLMDNFQGKVIEDGTGSIGKVMSAKESYMSSIKI